MASNPYAAFPTINRSVASGPAVPEDYRPDLAVRLTCPNCKDLEPDIVERFGSGDMVCRNCGLVLLDRIVDTRSEWRTFADDEGDDPSRVGAATNPLLDMGVSDAFETVISYQDGRTGVARDLKRAQQRIAQKNGTTSLLNAFREISAMCDLISLPKTVSDVAKQLYKRIDDEKLCRNKANDAVIAACIFIACRKSGVARSFNEIGTLTKVSKKALADCFRIIARHFELEPSSHPGTPAGGAEPGVAGSAASAADVVARFCDQLGLPAWVQSAAVGITTRINELGLGAGRSPLTVASAAIYFTSYLMGMGKSPKEIAQVSGISEATVRTGYKLFYPERERLVSEKLLSRGRADLSRLPVA